MIVKFLKEITTYLYIPTKAAACQGNIQTLFDLFNAIMVNSKEEIYEDEEKGRVQFDKDSLAFAMGIKLFNREEMIQYLGHFILQKKSPV